MNEQGILEQLLKLLESNGVTIRSEPLGGSGGGLCTIKGQNFFFLDTQASSADSAAACAETAAKVIENHSNGNL
jgi:hypothetical protein